MKAIVIMNESHTMMDDQERVIKENYDGYEILPVPAEGWTLEEMQTKVEELLPHLFAEPNDQEEKDIVFISPIPVLMVKLTQKATEKSGHFNGYMGNIRVFHNDHREKKELPNGKIISVVAKEGWQLV